MKITIIIEKDGGPSVTVSYDISGRTRTNVQDIAGQAYDLACNVDNSGKHLVLVGLQARTKISFIKAVRSGAGLSLKEAKDIVDIASTKNGIAQVPEGSAPSILAECDEAGLQALLLTTDEVACMEVHES